MSSDGTGDGIYYNAPAGYVEPKWPGLYPPLGHPLYLYNPYAIWKFTVIWTVVLHGVVFVFMSLFILPAFARRHARLSIAGAVVFVGCGEFGAFLSSTIVGYALAALYNANFLRMSTWVPALWGAIQTLILVSGSFSKMRTMVG